MLLIRVVLGRRLRDFWATHCYRGATLLGHLAEGPLNTPVPCPRSACRAVWYCGTACSHADWREGGHHRMCKALAAARQAAKQQARGDATDQEQ